MTLWVDFIACGCGLPFAISGRWVIIDAKRYFSIQVSPSWACCHDDFFKAFCFAAWAWALNLL
jgi:hypothetical protein